MGSYFELRLLMVLAATLAGPAITLAQTAPPPEPNTPVVLGLDFLFGFVPAAGAVIVTFGHPVGMYQRYIRGLVAVCLGLGLVCAPVIVASVATEPGQWPKSVALGAGMLVGLGLTGRRAYGRRGVPRPVLRLRPWFRPFDYIIGCCIYLGLALGLAGAAAQPPATDLPTRLVWFASCFALSQVTVNIMFRIVNHSLEQDYLVSFGLHHFLAGFPVAVSVAVYVAVGALPAGPASRLLLLAAAWRWTSQRPAGAVRTLRSLWGVARGRSATRSGVY